MSSVSKTIRCGGETEFSIRSTGAVAARLPISLRDTLVTVIGGVEIDCDAAHAHARP